MFDRLKSQLGGLIEKVSKAELKGKALDEVLNELRLALIENDVALPVADDICTGLREKAEGLALPRFSNARQPVKEILRDVLSETLRESGSREFFALIDAKRDAHQPAVIVFVGINGTGKTTSIAKLAHELMKRSYSVVLASADTYRSGAIEQLEEHAKRIGVRIIKHAYGGDAAAVAYDAINFAQANGINVVLIDTAGRMQTNKNLLEEMKKIVRVSKPDLVLLVVDSLTGNDAVEQGRSFASAVKLDGMILTKLDADAKGGSAISIANTIGIPVMFAGVGQTYDDIVSFDPNFVISKIFD